MKEVINYECDICKEPYTSKDAALTCEGKGVFNLTKAPKYVLYQGIEKMTFCLVKWNFFNNGFSENRHYGMSASWACRDTGLGDNLGNIFCGDGSLHVGEEYLSEYQAVTDFQSDHFRRMVEYLKSKGKPILFWDGNKIKMIDDNSIQK